MKALFVLLLSVASFAQSTVKKENHKFFTLNHIELSIAVGLIAADGLTSQKLASYSLPSGNGRAFLFKEYNPIARPFVKSTPGTIGYFSGSFAMLVGGNYLLRNHPTARHIVNWSVIGAEAYWVVNNTRALKGAGNSCASTWINTGVLIAPCHR